MAFRDTLKHFSNYFSANAATKALGFISIPVLTRLLTPAEYGIYSVFLTYVGMFVIIMPLNAHSAISRYWYEEKDDFDRFLGTSILLALISFGVTSLVLIVFKKQLSAFMQIDEILLLLLIPFVILRLVGLIFNQVFIPQRKSKMIARYEVIKAYGGFALGVALIFLFQSHRYYGVIAGQLIILFLVSLFMINKLKPYFYAVLNKGHLKYILKYSMPRLPHALSGIILAQFDRIMIKGYNGSEDAGLYSLAYNIGMLLSVFIIALLQAWTPDFYKSMNNKDYKTLDADIHKAFRLMLLGGMGLMLFGPDAGLILAGKEFHASLKIIPLIVTGYVFWGLWGFFSRSISYSYKTIWLSVVSLSAGMVNIILNAIYIPRYGYVAGAVTTVVSYILMAALGWFITKYILKLHVMPMFRFAWLIILMVVFYLPVIYFPAWNIPLFPAILLKFVIFVLFGVIIFYSYRHGFLEILRKYMKM